MRLLRGAILASTILASPAFAGEEVIYTDAPDWVEEFDIDAVLAESDGPSERLHDWQHRIEDSVVYAYTDRAVRIENPQALMEENQLSLSWLPDKGDLTVHKLEIYRAGKVVDLLADGVTFEVIRREQGLEQRLLDGELTATLSVPGLREGDVLRTTYTISTDDQALGADAQVNQFLPSEPWQVGNARTIVSWPVDEEIYWRVEELVDLPEPETRDGYRYIEVALPLPEAKPIPRDAPLRYLRPAVLRVGSFADWPELSRVMTPHFESAAQVEAGSPIAEQARAIMDKTDDPLERAALATRLVQDEVSYLLNGLDGGNYLPQAAEETWEVRYGDCKAKSVLLLSLLREMGITSEVVLVSSRAGDIVPELLPLPSAFDHMIVHATIDGQDYWLDGTSAATRLSNIADVPPFYWALPMREAGSGLLEMTQRDLAQPQMTMDVSVDHSAGVDFPMLISMDMIVTGAPGSQMRAMVDEENPNMLRELARNMNNGGVEGLQVSNLTIAYDDDTAVATIHIEGVAASEFKWNDGRLRMQLHDFAGYANFNPDRARAAWRDIPLRTGGPARRKTITHMILPDGGEGFRIEGQTTIDTQVANTRIVGEAHLDGGMITTSSETFGMLGEIPAADLPEAKRAARRLANLTLDLLPPDDVTWRWEVDAQERERRAAPILAAYDAAIEFADDADFGPLQARALFTSSIYDFARARADYDQLIEQSPSAWAYRQRAWALESLGQPDAAIADLREAWDLEPANSIAFDLARLLAYDGRLAEAADLLDILPVGEEDRIAYADIQATVSGLNGAVENGLDLLAEAVFDKPQNPEVLNADCWYRGLFNVAMDDALERCTLAVERAQTQSYALDSRALVRFRLGNFEGALADLDSALELSPGLAPSLYLRGIVRLHAGDGSGERDIASALRMMPQLTETYSRHGITPPS